MLLVRRCIYNLRIFCAFLSIAPSPAPGILCRNCVVTLVERAAKFRKQMFWSTHFNPHGANDTLATFLNGWRFKSSDGGGGLCLYRM